MPEVFVLTIYIEVIDFLLNLFEKRTENIEFYFLFFYYYRERKLTAICIEQSLL